MTIQNYTFFSPNGTEFPVSANADAKLYQMLSGMGLPDFRRKDWETPINTALNRQYVNTSLVVGGRYFELKNETVNLNPSASNFVHANIDLTNTTNPVSLSVEAADNSNAIDINNGSGVLKKLIETVVTDTMGVTSAFSPKQVAAFDTVQGSEIINTSDTGWLTLGTGGKYKRVGSRVSINFSYTPATNSNFNLGTLPVGFRPSVDCMFVMPAWAGDRANNVHVQINVNGSVTMLAPTANQRYGWQLTFEI